MPIVIHRALLGSFERFTGIITEHFKGAFPFWLCPYQVALVPIRTSHNEYAEKVEKALTAAGVRVEADYTDTHMNNKIKKFRGYKDPYILVLGDKEAETDTLSVSMRGSSNQIHDVPLDKFVEMCRKLNAERTLELVNPAE